ncbi:MAG: glycosyltransferase family 1 protein [Bdellovibrionota bacterium]
MAAQWDVCIDTTALVLAGAGVRRVLAETAMALSVHAEERPRIGFFPFLPRRYASGGHRAPVAAPLRKLFRPSLEQSVSLWARAGTPAIDSFLGGAALYHVSEYIPYPVRRTREIAIVHDVVALRYPEWCAPESVNWQRRRLEHIAKKAVHVIVPSEPVKRGWLLYSGWREERVSVIPWAVDPAFRRRGVGEIEHVKDRLRMQRPYFLHLGTIEPRKNLTFLLHSFELACRELPKDFDLVLAGPRGWRTEQFDQAVEFTRVRDRVKRLGAVAEEYLPALLSGATALVLPSYEEGFGLAALEALACGTPVVTTQAQTLPADLQPHCIRVGGADEEELAQTLADLADDKDASKAAQEEAAPLARARTWADVAGDFRRVYSGLL